MVNTDLLVHGDNASGAFKETGEIITIYDAEDSPDPLQLRRVIATFAQLPANTACVQAKLAFATAHRIC